MNAEMDKQRENVLVKIPITGDGTEAEDDDDDEPVAQSRMRKQSLAELGKRATSDAVSEVAVEVTVREEPQNHLLLRVWGI